jgi:hypothetical protein
MFAEVLTDVMLLRFAAHLHRWPVGRWQRRQRSLRQGGAFARTHRTAPCGPETLLLSAVLAMPMVAHPQPACTLQWESRYHAYASPAPTAGQLR